MSRLWWKWGSDLCQLGNRERHKYTPKPHRQSHTHTSSYFGSVLTVHSAAWWAWFKVELLAIAVVVGRQSALCAVKPKDNKATQIIQKDKMDCLLQWKYSSNQMAQASGDYKSRIMKTKWRKAFHISLAPNNKWLFCRISLKSLPCRGFYLTAEWTISVALGC